MGLTVESTHTHTDSETRQKLSQLIQVYENSEINQFTEKHATVLHVQ